MDRDTKFTARWREILADEGVAAVRLPPCSPNLNAHAEGLVCSIETECLDRMIFFGRSQRATVRPNHKLPTHMDFG